MTEDTFNTLIEAVESGVTLKRAIATAKTSWRALSLHLERDADAASRYARARTVSATFWADRAVREVERAKTLPDAQIGKIRADVYKWRAAMADPDSWGAKREQAAPAISIGALHLAALTRASEPPTVIARIASPDDASPVPPLDAA